LEFVRKGEVEKTKVDEQIQSIYWSIDFIDITNFKMWNSFMEW